MGNPMAQQQAMVVALAEHRRMRVLQLPAITINQPRHHPTEALKAQRTIQIRSQLGIQAAPLLDTRRGLPLASPRALKLEVLQRLAAWKQLQLLQLALSHMEVQPRQSRVISRAVAQRLRTQA